MEIETEETKTIVGKIIVILITIIIVTEVMYIGNAERVLKNQILNFKLNKRN